MKKVLKLIFLSVLCLTVMSAAVLAAENIAANNDGTFPASYAEGAEGEYYALVVVTGIYSEGDTPTISENTVVHIDQVTAGENGALFEDFTPNSNAPATVYVGGSDLDDGPVILGYINNEVLVKEHKVSVAVKADSDAAATVKLTAEGTEVTAVLNTETGKYEATVAEGTYKLTVSVPKHLSYTMNELVVAADVDKAVTVKGGELDINGTIDFDDLNVVLNNYGEVVEDADIDGIGTVNFDDLNIVLNNYGATAVVE